jgi:hypothetical protein
MKGYMRHRSGGCELRVYAGRDPVTGRKRYLSRTARGGKREAQRTLAALIVEAGETAARRRARPRRPRPASGRCIRGAGSHAGRRRHDHAGVGGEEVGVEAPDSGLGEAGVVRDQRDCLLVGAAVAAVAVLQGLGLVAAPLADTVSASPRTARSPIRSGTSRSALAASARFRTASTPGSPEQPRNTSRGPDVRAAVGRDRL